MLIPCIDCKEPIRDYGSIKTLRCDACRRKKKKTDTRKYRDTHRRGCFYCGKQIVVPGSWTGIVYCYVCGADGTGRKKKFVSYNHMNRKKEVW